ncbi:MAG TPA: alanine racemase, partial [Spirochaeta sp.]|nr:alanine racemase [Spirochaeta sp.]
MRNRAETGRTYSLKQIERFRAVSETLRSLGVTTFHMANSAAIFSLPKAHMDLYRPGISV